MIAIDFEFRNAQNRDPDLVCCVLQEDNQKKRAYPLHKKPDKYIKLKEYLMTKIGETIIAYSADAEARCFLALGLDPWQYKWIDLMVLYRYCINTAGRPPKTGLIDACNYCGIIYRHSEKKKNIRNLILNSDKFTDEEMMTILKYCAEDTGVLLPMYKALNSKMETNYPEIKDKIFKIMLYHSQFSVATAFYQRVGIPVDKTSIKNLSNNFLVTRFYLIENLSDNHPAFIYNGHKQDFVFRRQILDEHIANSNSLCKIWPRTPAGNSYSFDQKDVKRMPLDDFLQKWYDCHRLLTDLKFFHAENELLSAIGIDNRMRTYFNQYGTISARNAPPARTFIPAMSRIFRSLIRPPKGVALTGCDWSQQEFFLGAVLSGDNAMLQAYKSGDPYLHFGKLSGAIPAEGTKATHGELRDLFKSTTLGLQYGMGVNSLRLKLCADTGQYISMKKAANLMNLHKKVFKKYWKWHKNIIDKAKRYENIYIKDGWGIKGNPDRKTTYGNWPVQSSGSMLMRYAVTLAVKRGLDVIFPLHDAIYVLHAENDTEAPVKLKQCMDDAVTKFFPGHTIRVDSKTLTHDDIWLEADRQKYELISKFYKAEPGVELETYIPPNFEFEQLFN